MRDNGEVFSRNQSPLLIKPSYIPCHRCSHARVASCSCIRTSCTVSPPLPSLRDGPATRSCGNWCLLAVLPSFQPPLQLLPHPLLSLVQVVNRCQQVRPMRLLRPFSDRSGEHQSRWAHRACGKAYGNNITAIPQQWAVRISRLALGLLHSEESRNAIHSPLSKVHGI